MGKLNFFNLRGRLSLSINTIINVSFIVLVGFVSISFYYWLNREISQKLTDINRELNASVSNAERILSYRSIDQLISSESRTKPLVPMLLDRHPSPFDATDINYFYESSLNQTYFSRGNLSTRISLAVGYSSVLLSNGRKGDSYLSVMIWHKGSDLKLYTSNDIIRTSAGYLRLLYYGESGSIHSALISFQLINNSENEDSSFMRIGEVSGFIEPKLNQARNLQLDRTIKGSIFKSRYDDQNFITFRMRVKSPKETSRETIDLSRPVGIFFVENPSTPDANVSTFEIKENELTDSPNFTQNNISNALNSLPSEIKSVSLKTKIDSADLHLLDRPIEKYQDRNIASRFFLEWFTRSAELKGIGASQDKNNAVVIQYTNEFSAIYTPGNIAFLRVIADATSVFESFVENLSQLSVFYVISMAITLLVFILLKLYLVKRIKNLSKSLSRFPQEGENKKHRVPSIFSSDEIGNLAKSIHSLIFRLEFRRKKLARTNRIIQMARLLAEDRFSRSEELIKVIGHNIRTPLAVLMSIHEKDEESLKNLKKIQRAIETVVESTKMENDKAIDPRFNSINVTEFINSIASSVEDRFKGKVKCLIPDSPIFMETDAELLEDALDPVIDNSEDYGTEIVFMISKSEKYTLIEIVNNGESIDEDLISEIFSFGVSSRLNSDEDHHGIGLFLTHQKIGLLGGRVRAENRADAVAFIFEFPNQCRED